MVAFDRVRIVWQYRDDLTVDDVVQQKVAQHPVRFLLAVLVGHQKHVLVVCVWHLLSQRRHSGVFSLLLERPPH